MGGERPVICLAVALESTLRVELMIEDAIGNDTRKQAKGGSPFANQATASSASVVAGIGTGFFETYR